MILHGRDTIERYTRAGLWGERTLLDIFDANRARHPQRPAVSDPPNRRELVASAPRDLTWGELGAAVDSLTAGLREHGLARDEVVVIQLPNVWELVALLLAVVAAGGIPSPLPMQWRRREVAHVVSTTGARFYVGAEAFKGIDHLAMARGLDGESTLDTFLGLDDVTRMADAGGVFTRPRLDANDVFSICWTSGTEAGSKGCPLTHNNWLFQSGSMVRLLGLEDGDRMLCPAPLVNMTGFGVILVPWLLCGGTLVLHHPLDIELLLRQLADGDIQFTILVPALLNMIIKLPDVDALDLSAVRSIATGSAPPSAHSLEEFKRRWGIEISNLWGQNEGTALIGGPLDVPELERRVDHLPWWGRDGCDWPSGIEGVSVKLVGDDGSVSDAPGEVGELAFRGPNVFPGYFRRPELNDKAFDAQGYFYTGDLFKVQDACHLAFFDRKKDIVIRGGFNISAAEVENLAVAHDAVVDAAAVAIPDDTLGEKVCLCVVPADPEAPPTLAAITGYMRNQGIADYKLPEALLVLDEIPRNPVGKILKRELRARAPGAASDS